MTSREKVPLKAGVRSKTKENPKSRSSVEFMVSTLDDRVILLRVINAGGGFVFGPYPIMNRPCYSQEYIR